MDNPQNQNANPHPAQSHAPQEGQSHLRHKRRYRGARREAGHHAETPSTNPLTADEHYSMRRKPNNNGKNNNNNNQMARRRFHPNQNNSGKIKSAATSREKYLNLAREALAQGDRIEAENFLQHADHYFRVLSALQEEDARNRPQYYDHPAQGQDQGSEAETQAGDAQQAGGQAVEPLAETETETPSAPAFMAAVG